MSRHDINFVLDTVPMAREIETVSHRVDGTTTAVVAMQAAVVKAEKDGSDFICENVNRGFFSLMHSQISQKIAAKQSRTEALLMELNAQKKRLLEIKSTMERDYRRIAARYERIIVSINKQLKQRVQDLDQPIFKFAEREMATTKNRLGLLTGTIPVCQLEGVGASQKILSSNIKYDSLGVVESTKRFLEHNNEQKIVTGKILLNSMPGVDAEQKIPVLISVGTLDRSGSENMSVYISDAFSQQSQQMVKNEVYNQAAGLQWKPALPTANNMVDQEFARLMASSRASKRVKDTAMKLYKSTQMMNL